MGSGSGHFLTHYALKHEKCNFIGIELKKKRYEKIIKKIKKNDLSNVIIYYGKAEEFLERLPHLSVDAFHFYFPDPWPKNKHRKRRFFKIPMLDVVHRCLKPGGIIYFASDIFDYYFQVKILSVLHKGFEIAQENLPDEVHSSMYSKKMKEAGKNINALVIKKSRS